MRKKTIEIRPVELSKLELPRKNKTRSIFERNRIRNKLSKALTLSIFEDREIKISIRDKYRGLFKVKAKVSMVSEENVYINNKFLMPIASIVKIDLI